MVPMANENKLATAMGAARLLTEARDFIKDQKHWIKASLYSGIEGGDAEVSLASASRVCAIGGVMKVANLGIKDYNDIATDCHAEAFEALQTLANVIQGRARHYESGFWQWAADVHAFNDAGNTSHAEVIGAFDKAVERQCAVVRDLAAQTGKPTDGQKDHAS